MGGRPGSRRRGSSCINSIMNDLSFLPYDVENIIASRARMGLIALATDHVIEHELNKLFNGIKGVQLYTTKVPMVPNVTTDTIEIYG